MIRFIFLVHLFTGMRPDRCATLFLFTTLFGVCTRAVESESESRSRSRKNFQPEKSELQKILTTPTPGRPFAHQL